MVSELIKNLLDSLAKLKILSILVKIKYKTD